MHVAYKCVVRVPDGGKIIIILQVCVLMRCILNVIDGG